MLGYGKLQEKDGRMVVLLGNGKEEREFTSSCNLAIATSYVLFSYEEDGSLVNITQIDDLPTFKAIEYYGVNFTPVIQEESEICMVLNKQHIFEETENGRTKVTAFSEDGEFVIEIFVDGDNSSDFDDGSENKGLLFVRGDDFLVLKDDGKITITNPKYEKIIYS